MSVDIAFAQISVSLRCLTLSGEERLGDGFTLEAELESLAPISGADVLGQAVTVQLQTEHGDRRVAGIVSRWRAVATVSAAERRVYRAQIRPLSCKLELRRRSRIYRDLDLPAIVEKLLVEIGYDPGAIRKRLNGSHPVHEHVVQYDETDAAFVRRLCEDEGFFVRLSCEEDEERLHIEDDSPSAQAALDEPLLLVDDARLLATEPGAHHARVVRRRRPAKVLLDDYDPEHPAVNLAAEALADDASDAEKEAALFQAPGGYRQDGSARARLALECARARARTVELMTNEPQLVPGTAFELEPRVGGAGVPSGPHVIVAVRHAYRREDERHLLHVEAIAKEVPFRLERVTPTPRIAGLQSAIVTGSPGEEIHTDALGRSFVRFHWDLEAPQDETSSSPIRTLQPNMPDSMLLPRVGWEVLVAFEDGDPSRPYVVGRSYTSKMPPPFPLPANKTITSFATDSSPGAGGRNSIHLEDAAGREHLKIQATFNKNVTVGDRMVTQTGNNERHSVLGNMKHSIGAEQVLSVGQAMVSSVGSLTTNVGAFQSIDVAGDFGTRVGSETVVVGALLLESAGNPVKGVLNLGMNAALQLIGSRGAAGAVIAAGLGIGKATVEGYLRGGREGAERAAKMAGTGVLAGLVPGGEAVMATVTGSTQPNPWDHGRAADGAAAPGGGAGAGASDAAAASGPGPGHRIINCSGVGLEGVNNFIVVTPGQIGWTTAGAAVLVTAGSKRVKAATGTHRSLGASVDSLGSRSVKTKEKLNRKSLVRAAITSTGTLKIDAGSQYGFHASSATIDVGGALTMGDIVTFQCGNSTIIASRSLVAIETPRLEVTGTYTQSGGMCHS